MESVRKPVLLLTLRGRGWGGIVVKTKNMEDRKVLLFSLNLFSSLVTIYFISKSMHCTVNTHFLFSSASLQD